MLDLAYNYKDKLNEVYKTILYDDRYKYYQESYLCYNIEIKDDNEKMLQFVSIDKNSNILGYFDAYVDREDNIVRCFSVLSFTNKCNVVFSKDFYKFIENLIL